MLTEQSPVTVKVLADAKHDVKRMVAASFPGGRIPRRSASPVAGSPAGPFPGGQLPRRPAPPPARSPAVGFPGGRLPRRPVPRRPAPPAAGSPAGPFPGGQLPQWPTSRVAGSPGGRLSRWPARQPLDAIPDRRPVPVPRLPARRPRVPAVQEPGVPPWLSSRNPVTIAGSMRITWSISPVTHGVSSCW